MSDPGAGSRDPICDPASPRQDDALAAWRRCTRRVDRAWQQWLAASTGQRRSSHGELVRALADEERAAREVERACLEPVSVTSESESRRVSVSVSGGAPGD